jgi:hypothetical protein
MPRVLLIDDDQSNLDFMRQQARFIGSRRGAIEALGKPFDLEQRRSAIRRCLGQERP